MKRAIWPRVTLSLGQNLRGVMTQPVVTPVEKM